MNFLKKIAPWIGAAATGNVPALVAMAANSIGGVIGKKVDANPSAIAAAVAGASPDQLLALQKEDHDFQARMQQMGFQEITDLAKIQADDRASARNMQIQVRSQTPNVLSALAVVSLLGCIGLVAFVPLPDKSMDAILILLGVVAGSYKDVYAYYFGSSAGSDRKTELMASGKTESK